MSKLRHKWTKEVTLQRTATLVAECENCHCTRMRLRRIFAGVARFTTTYRRESAFHGRATKRAPACVQRRLL